MRNYKPKVGSKKKKYLNFSEDVLARAVTAVERGASYREVECKFGVPKSTVHRRIKRINNKPMGGQTALSREEEQSLVHHLIVVSEWGFPFSNLDLRLLVKGYLERTSRKVKCFKNNTPGEDWARSFLKRHRTAIGRRTCQNIKTSRAEMKKDDFVQYFENLKKALEDVPPTNILNFDETNLSDDPGNEKLIFKRGVKYPERIQNYTKGSTSVMFCGTATGDLLEPYVVYKATNMWNSWTTGGPPRARYNRSKSGWFDNVSFNDWFTTVILPWCRRNEGPKVIIGDNLSSHFSPDIIRFCEKNNIRFICLVPNSTHLSQPLDVAFYGPMKRIWRKILKDWKMRNQSFTTLPKDSFPKLLKELMDTLNLENLKSGFKACGIYPMDPNEVLKKIPGESAKEIQLNVSQVVLQRLQNMRNQEERPKIRRKRVQVDPGKSITSVDIQTDQEEVMKVEESSSSDEEDTSSGNENNAEEIDENLDTNLKLLPYSKVNEGDWIKVIYEGEVFLGKVIKKQAREFLVRCLEKPFAIGGPNKLEREDSVIFYKQVYEANVVPELKKFGRVWEYAY